MNHLLIELRSRNVFRVAAANLTTIATACILTVALLLISACSQNAPPESNAEPVGNTETVETPANMDPKAIAIAELKAEMPDHAPFVDDDGIFNVDEAARALFETGNFSAEEAYDRAEQMESEWDVAYALKHQEVVTRV